MWPMRWWRECSFSITLNLESCLPTSAFAIGFSSQAWVIQLGSRPYTTQPTDPLLEPMTPIQGEVFAMILLKNIYFASFGAIARYGYDSIETKWSVPGHLSAAGPEGTFGMDSRDGHAGQVRTWQNTWSGPHLLYRRQLFMEWSPFVVQQMSIVLACPAKTSQLSKESVGIWGCSLWNFTNSLKSNLEKKLLHCNHLGICIDTIELCLWGFDCITQQNELQLQLLWVCVSDQSIDTDTQLCAINEMINDHQYLLY